MELYWLCFVIFCLHMYCNYKFTGPTQCSILLCSSGGLPPKINSCREISRIKTSTCIYLKMSFPFGPVNPVFFFTFEFRRVVSGAFISITSLLPWLGFSVGFAWVCNDEPGLWNEPLKQRFLVLVWGKYNPHPPKKCGKLWEADQPPTEFSRAVCCFSFC